MWCSAAVDILFLLDGSHSIGKGSFERSKRFAIAACDALDISPGRVSANVTPLMSFVWSDRISSLGRGRNGLCVGCRGLRGKLQHGGTDAGVSGIGRPRQLSVPPLLSLPPPSVPLLLLSVASHTAK